MRVREEGYFHTPEQVREHVRGALGIADELGLKGEDRAALLPTILSLVSAKQVVFEAGAAAMVSLPAERLR